MLHARLEASPTCLSWLANSRAKSTTLHNPKSRSALLAPAHKRQHSAPLKRIISGSTTLKLYLDGVIEAGTR